MEQSLRCTGRSWTRAEVDGLAGCAKGRVGKMRGRAQARTKCEDETKNQNGTERRCEMVKAKKSAEKNPGEHGTRESDKKDEMRREPSSENIDTKRGRGSASHNKRYPFKEAVLRRRGK